MRGRKHSDQRRIFVQLLARQAARQIRIIWILALLAACDRESVYRSGIPVQYCAESNIHFVPSLGRHSRGTASGDSIFIADVAIARNGNGFYYLDPIRGIRAVDSLGATTRVIQPRDLGFENFSQVNAVEFGVDHALYLITSDGTLHVFDYRLVPVHRIPLPIRAHDLAIAEDGSVYMTSAPLASDKTNRRNEPYAVRLSADFNDVDTLLSLHSGDVGKRPFIGPIHNPVYVTATAGGSLVWYLYDRSAHLFVGSKAVRSVQGCMDAPLLDFYQEQAKAGSRLVGALVSVAGAWANGDTIILASYDMPARLLRRTLFVPDGNGRELASRLSDHQVLHMHRRQTHLGQGRVLIWSQRRRQHFDIWTMQ